MNQDEKLGYDTGVGMDRRGLIQIIFEIVFFWRFN